MPGHRKKSSRLRVRHSRSRTHKRTKTKRKSSQSLRGGSGSASASDRRIRRMAGHLITPIDPKERERERNKSCHKVNWEHPNINKGTDCMLSRNLTDTYDDDREADTALVAMAPVTKLQAKIEAAVDAEDYEKVVELNGEMQGISPMLYRGMSLDFYRSQGGVLQPKCPDCDTTVKYHIRQGNDAGARLSYDCSGESRALGTKTNYISFTEDFETAVKYATIIGDSLSQESIIAFIHPGEIHDRFDFLKPDESWLEKTTRSSEELECDPARGIPRKGKYSRRGSRKTVGGVRMNPTLTTTGVSMAGAAIHTSRKYPIRPYEAGTSMTEDWVTHDTEVLVKIKDPKGTIPFTEFVKLEGCGLFHITSRVATREAKVLESLPEDPESDDINKFEIDRFKGSRETRQHANQPHFLGLRPASISSCTASDGVLTCKRTKKPVAMDRPDRPFEGHVPHEFTFRNTQLGEDIVITIVEIWDILNQPESGELEALLHKFEE